MLQLKKLIMHLSSLYLNLVALISYGVTSAIATRDHLKDSRLHGGGVFSIHGYFSVLLFLIFTNSITMLVVFFILNKIRLISTQVLNELNVST